MNETSLVRAFIDLADNAYAQVKRIYYHKYIDDPLLYVEVEMENPNFFQHFHYTPFGIMVGMEQAA